MTILPFQRSMQAKVITYNGVVIDWNCNIQAKVATNSTNVEFLAISAACCKSLVLHNFLTSGNFLSDILKPIVIFANNEGAIDLLKTNKLTYYRSRHEDEPIAFSHENYILGYYNFYNISTKLNAADTSTKSTTGPALQHNWEFLRGLRFYPTSSTPHGLYLRTTSSTQPTLDNGK